MIISNLPPETIRHITLYLTEIYICNFLIAIRQYDDIPRNISYEIMIFKAIESGDLNLVKFVKHHWKINPDCISFESSLASFRLYYDIYEYLDYEDEYTCLDQNMYVMLEMYDCINPTKGVSELYDRCENISEISCEYLLQIYNDNPTNYYEIMAVGCKNNYHNIVQKSQYITYSMLRMCVKTDNIDMYNILRSIFIRTCRMIDNETNGATITNIQQLEMRRDIFIKLYRAYNMSILYGVHIPDNPKYYTYVSSIEHLLFDDVMCTMYFNECGFFTRYDATLKDLSLFMKFLDSNSRYIRREYSIDELTIIIPNV